MDKLKHEVLEYISGATKEHPADRYIMAQRFGAHEREVRNVIEVLRNEGKRICSSSSRGGYWIAESEEDYKRFRAEYLSRANKTYKTARAMDGAAAGQMEMMIL